MIKEYERKRATEDPLDVKAERMEKLYGPLCSQCGEHEKEHPIGDCECFVGENKMNTVINLELVVQITTLVQVWNTADRHIREMLHGWEQRAARAGLERGFYMQVGQLDGIDTITDLDDDESAGRIVYAAYMQGGIVANIDTL